MHFCRATPVKIVIKLYEKEEGVKTNQKVKVILGKKKEECALF